MRASAARGSPWLPVHKRQHLVGRQVAVALDAAEVLHAVEIAGLARDLDHPLHGPADEHDFAACGARRGGDGADAVHVRRKRGDRHTAGRRADEFGKGLGDVSLRRRSAVANCVC